MKKKVSLTMATTFAMVLFAGCSSHNVTIAPEVPENYEVLGKAEGTASGSLGILSTAYNFIPMGLNSRTARAYNNAIESVPGATGLINVTYKENWFWWVIGTNRTVTISGEAIKEIK